MTVHDLPVLPRQPGCYLYLDVQGKVLYVGKAKSLSSRVRSYFSRLAEAKARLLVVQAARLEFVVTKNEVEALILEANLIKRHQPHFNVVLKDDKSYPFLKLTNEAYPMLEFTRRVLKDGAQYFGPYPNPSAVRQVQRLIGTLFPLRVNSGSPLQKRHKPCLRFHMGRCLAPCIDHTSPEAYAAVVKQVKAFLEGRVEEIASWLTAEMQAAAKRQDFELARVYRDRKQALERLGYDSTVALATQDDLDVIGVAQAGNYAMTQLFQMRRGRIIGRDKRFLTNAQGATVGEMLERFMADYYGQATHLPPLVLIPSSTLDRGVWQQFLSQRAGRKVELRVPQRGDKTELLGLAERNAKIGLEAELALLERRGEAPGVTELQHLAELTEPPYRIEGFDVSNLMGTHTVASIVVFEGGRAKKSEYRRLIVRGLSQPDDYYAMHQAVSRRFTGSLADKLPLPDLLLIDGGLGQLTAARRALDEAGIKLPMLGLAKRREAIIREHGAEILAQETHPGLRLLIHIRDEAHRTAVGYNRQRRGSAMTRSVLEEIPGIGPKRRDLLLAHFSSLEQLKAADLEQLAGIPGLGRGAAEAVKAYFSALPNA
jgi:excinuclease ABC subunit C